MWRITKESLREARVFKRITDECKHPKCERRPQSMMWQAPTVKDVGVAGHHVRPSHALRCLRLLEVLRCDLIELALRRGGRQLHC